MLPRSLLRSDWSAAHVAFPRIASRDFDISMTHHSRLFHLLRFRRPEEYWLRLDIIWSISNPFQCDTVAEFVWGLGVARHGFLDSEESGGMEQSATMPERARKKGRYSQHPRQVATIQQPEQQSALSYSCIPRQGRCSPRPVAARGASPTRNDRWANFSYATVPALQNFGDLSVVASGNLVESNFPTFHTSSGTLLSQMDESTAMPPDLELRDLEAVDDLSGAPSTGQSLRSGIPSLLDTAIV